MEKKQTSQPAAVLKENSIADLSVARVAAFGAFLSAGTGNSSDDILLHKHQQTKTVKVGDRVKVFLYHDPRGRLTASMHLPKISIGDIGYASVLLTTRFGAFVDIGTERGIFLPFSEMIDGHVTQGQRIWVKLYVDKTGRLALTMHVDKEMQEISVPVSGIKIGDTVEGSIYNKTKDGAFLITRQKWIGFIHSIEADEPLAMGDMISARVTYIRPDGRMDLSLRPVKEKALMEDGDVLLSFMKHNGGELLYNDHSNASDIMNEFHLSKAAFKRAVGHLMKNQKIEKKNDHYYLK